METLDLLEAVLDDYEGTLILVSHDRDFLDRLVTAVIAMEGDGRTIEVAGGYSDYRRYKQDQGESATRARAADDKVRSKVEAPRPKKTTKHGYKEQRDLDQHPPRSDALHAEAAAVEPKRAQPALYKTDHA